MSIFDFFKKRDAKRTPLTFESNGRFEIVFCAGEEALVVLGKLRAEGRGAGFTAILLGGEDSVGHLAENQVSLEQPIEEVLRRSMSVDTNEWLKKQYAADEDYYSAVEGTWPQKAVETGSICAHLDLQTQKPKEKVGVAKMATPRNWEAPAFVGMGGWNACPESEVLTAFAKRWNEAYGAEIVSITHDTMEFSVSRPPSNRVAAMMLAKEHCAFCNDIVDQGVGTISDLAATLLKADYWFFWWD